MALVSDLAPEKGSVLFQSLLRVTSLSRCLQRDSEAMNACAKFIQQSREGPSYRYSLSRSLYWQDFILVYEIRGCLENLLFIVFVQI